MDGNKTTPSPWKYQPQTTTTAPVAEAPAPSATGTIQWTASEFVAHHKSAAWYGRLAIGAILVAAVAFWLVDLTSAIVILFAAVAFGVFAGREPRELRYQLDNHGIIIDKRAMPYSQFRGFSLIQEGAFRSITLLPLKRFAPAISIYYDPNDEEVITTTLSQHLPFEQRSQDPLDRLLWRIRF